MKILKKIILCIISLIISLIGLIFIITGLIEIDEYSIKKKEYIETNAVITKIEDSNSNYSGDSQIYILNKTIYISYRVNDITYSKHINLFFNNDFLYEGEQIKIAYNPSNPDDIIGSKLNSRYKLLIIGLILSPFFIIVLVREIKEKKKNKEVN